MHWAPNISKHFTFTTELQYGQELWPDVFWRTKENPRIQNSYIKFSPNSDEFEAMEIRSDWGTSCPSITHQGRTWDSRRPRCTFIHKDAVWPLPEAHFNCTQSNLLVWSLFWNLLHPIRWQPHPSKCSVPNSLASLVPLFLFYSVISSLANSDISGFQIRIQLE